jgi:hypothetical protein
MYSKCLASSYTLYLGHLRFRIGITIFYRDQSGVKLFYVYHVIVPTRDSRNLGSRFKNVRYLFKHRPRSSGFAS